MQLKTDTIIKNRTTEKSQVNIEYAHIYIDQQYSLQHELGIKQLKQHLNQLDVPTNKLV